MTMREHMHIHTSVIQIHNSVNLAKVCRVDLSHNQNKNSNNFQVLYQAAQKS